MSQEANIDFFNLTPSLRWGYSREYYLLLQLKSNRIENFDIILYIILYIFLYSLQRKFKNTLYMEMMGWWQKYPI